MLKTAVAAMIKHGSLHSIISVNAFENYKVPSSWKNDPWLPKLSEPSVTQHFNGLEVLISDPHLQASGRSRPLTVGVTSALGLRTVRLPTRFRATPWLHCVTMAQWQLIHWGYDRRQNAHFI